MTFGIPNSVLIQEQLAKVAPVIWDERINDYLDQVNIYTAKEIYESVDGETK